MRPIRQHRQTKAQVAAMQDAIIRSHLAGRPGIRRAITKFELTPAFAVNVTAAELEALAADPRVKAINPDRAGAAGAPGAAPAQRSLTWMPSARLENDRGPLARARRVRGHSHGADRGGLFHARRPAPYDSTIQPVMVEIVPESELAAAKEPPKEPVPPKEPKLDFPEDKMTENKPQPESSTPTKTPPPQQAAGPPAAAEPMPQATAPDPFAASPYSFPTLLPGLEGAGFDAPADSAAKLTAGEIAAFHAHLQKCWHPPASVAGAQKLSASLRIALTPAGMLSGDPVLIRASASAQGPRLVETATRALQQCQPFSFLPAAKYQEWKLLDLSFSPRGLGG